MLGEETGKRRQSRPALSALKKDEARKGADDVTSQFALKMHTWEILGPIVFGAYSISARIV